TSWPATTTVPVSGMSNPPATCRRVDLPAPEGPVTTTNSPASSVKSKSTSTCSCSSPLRYVLLTAVSCSTGVTLVIVTRVGCYACSRALLNSSLEPDACYRLFVVDVGDRSTGTSATRGSTALRAESNATPAVSPGTGAAHPFGRCASSDTAPSD